MENGGPFHNHEASGAIPLPVVAAARLLLRGPNAVPSSNRRLDVPFTSRGLRGLRNALSALSLTYTYKGVETMTEMRTLFEALLVLCIIVATGTVLGVIFR
jgi:hypothetical protein